MSEAESTAGRFELDLPFVRGSSDEARRVERGLAELAGVGSVSIDAATGHLLLVHDPADASSGQILAAIGDRIAAATPLGRRACLQPKLAEAIADHIAGPVLEAALRSFAIALA